MATKKTTARELYHQRRREIAGLLKWLNAELDKHDQAAANEPQDYGYAGNLGHVQEKLVEIVAFLSNQESTEIEARLTK